MSPTIWTPTALASEARPWSGHAWRIVEAQHQASTMKLVDDVNEQEALEAMLESAKPPRPRSSESLHYLLGTPFRYPPLPSGSRFRAGGEPGVFYGSRRLSTACAELGYWRWHFLKDAPDLARLGPLPQTAFKASINAAAIDLRVSPFEVNRALWTAMDYTATQSLARMAREGAVEAIVYESVRDPQRGECIALLTPSGFVARAPHGATQTWWLTVQRRHVTWIRDQERYQFEYP